MRWTRTPGTISAFYRVLVADLGAIALLCLQRKPLPRLDGRRCLMGLLGGVFFAADLALYNTAALRHAAGTVALLGNSAPLFVGLLTWLFLKRRPPARFWTGLSIALCGSSLIILLDRGSAPAFGIADGMALCSAACFSIYLVATERLRSVLDALPLLVLSLSVSTVALAVAGWAQGFSFHVPTASGWFAVLGLGLVCQLLGYLALTGALGALPATVTSISLLAQAPLTALLALAFFGEQVRLPQLSGAALVLLGIWVVTYR